MIDYRIVTSSSCPTEDDLAEQWAAGYELVSVVGIDQNNAPKEYCAYYKYSGGVRAGRSVIGGGR